MNKMETFQNFITGQNIEVGIEGFIINLLLTFILSSLLAYFYVTHGRSFSNRRVFSQNFALVAMTTMIIITIVKSSLALSLGLVGALSIVRFRAAIKEPEELSYLFFNIAIGLGLGAGQRIIILVGFFVVIGILWSKSFYSKATTHHNLYLTISGRNAGEAVLGRIVEVIKSCCSTVNMKRLDETKDHIDMTFLVELNNFEELNSTKKQLRQIDDAMKITFIDNKGIM